MMRITIIDQNIILNLFAESTHLYHATPHPLFYPYIYSVGCIQPEVSSGGEKLHSCCQQMINSTASISEGDATWG